MKTKLSVRKIFALLLSLALLFTATACSNETTDDASSILVDDVIYGDEEYDYEDDDTTVTITTSNAGTAQGSNGGGNNAWGTTSNNGGTVGSNRYTIDEDAKEKFLKSVPSSLKGQEVSIFVWWKPWDFEVEKMKVFEKKTGIKVKWIQSSSGDWQSKLTALIGSGNSPDIAAFSSSNFPLVIMQDYFRPLSDGKLNMKQTELYDIKSMDYFKWDGKYYGATFKGTSHMSMTFMMYNADLFKKHGVDDPAKLWKANNWNWDTFLTTAQNIQKKSGVIAVTGEYQLNGFAQTCGLEGVGIANGKIVNNLDNQVFRNACKWVANLKDDGQYKVASDNIRMDGFLQQKAVMMPMQIWALQKGERFEKASFTIGYAPMPCPKGSKLVVPSNAQMWGFPKGSKHIEAASYALEYWMNTAFNEAGHSIWANESAAEFIDYLWEQEKVINISQGVVEYGGDYKWSDYVYQINVNVSMTDSRIDQWSGVIDSNIAKINKDYKK